MINPTPNVNCQYGAPMGRPAFGHGVAPTTAFTLRRIRLNNGGYDRGGAYWGVGAPLYWYCAYGSEQVPCGQCRNCGWIARNAINGECRVNGHYGEHSFEMRDEETEVSDYIRASSRDHAKDIVRAKYPAATFKR